MRPFRTTISLISGGVYVRKQWPDIFLQGREGQFSQITDVFYRI
jgi:hypothetical protein